jgi:hypothetical protein
LIKELEMRAFRFCAEQPSDDLTLILKSLFLNKLDSFATNYRAGAYVVLASDVPIVLTQQVRIDGTSHILPTLETTLTILVWLDENRVTVTLLLRFSGAVNRSTLSSLTHAAGLELDRTSYSRVLTSVSNCLSIDRVRLEDTVASHGRVTLPTTVSIAVAALEQVGCIDCRSAPDMADFFDQFRDVYRTLTFSTVSVHYESGTIDKRDAASLLYGYSDFIPDDYERRVNDANVAMKSSSLLLVEFNRYISVRPIESRSDWLVWGILAGEVTSHCSFLAHVFSSLIRKNDSIYSTPSGSALETESLERTLEILSTIEDVNHVQTPILREVLRRLEINNRTESTLVSLRANLSVVTERRSSKLQLDSLNEAKQIQESLSAILADVRGAIMQVSAGQNFIATLTYVLIGVSITGVLVSLRGELVPALQSLSENPGFAPGALVGMGIAGFAIISYLTSLRFEAARTQLAESLRTLESSSKSQIEKKKTETSVAKPLESG